MLLTDLPEEVLVIIIRKLDISSVSKLYSTCRRLRSIVCMQGVFRKCSLSRNIMATVNTLKLTFFKDISNGLAVLNMSGVRDLNRTTVLPAMKKLQQLKALDISYTNLDILDLVDIQAVCPNLHDITINLSFGDKGMVPDDVKSKCQAVFEHFTNVHLVGSLLNMLDSKLMLFLFDKCKLRHLKFTCTRISSLFIFVIDKNVSEKHYNLVTDKTLLPCFDQFTAYINDLSESHTSVIASKYYPGLLMYDITKYEYIVIAFDECNPKVYASTMFSKFFKEKFGLAVEGANIYVTLSPNTTVMFWNKTMNFDDIFYHRLAKTLKRYLPCYFPLSGENVNSVLLEYDWFYTIPTEPSNVKSVNVIKRLGNKRVAAPNFLLNYDDVFRGKKYIELSIVFKNPVNSAIGLTADCEYLKKITYLSLLNLGRYSSDFFNILFSCCVNLITLNVEGAAPPCANTIARHLPATQTLKNFRLVDMSINIAALFAAFVKCPTIENIHIVDSSLLNNELANPSLMVKGCPKLHYVNITGKMSLATRTKTLQLFNKAKKECNKKFLNMDIIVTSEPPPVKFIYDTFIDEFRLYPVKPTLPFY